MDQPGKVANPARGQLNRENDIPLSPCVPENLVSRDGFSRPVPRQPAHLHIQAESGAYLRDSSRVPRRRPYETAIRIEGRVGTWRKYQREQVDRNSNFGFDILSQKTWEKEDHQTITRLLDCRL